MEETTLRSLAISCNHCIMAIKRALTGLPGVQAVEGDPAAKQVKVTYDAAQISLDKIKAVMAEEGYPVEA
jgi:copper chaperone